MTTKIQLADWKGVTSELRQFGATGDIITDGERIRVEFGSAYIEVTEEGTISTGIPLHNLDIGKCN